MHFLNYRNVYLLMRSLPLILKFHSEVRKEFQLSNISILKSVIRLFVLMLGASKMSNNNMFAMYESDICVESECHSRSGFHTESLSLWMSADIVILTRAPILFSISIRWRNWSYREMRQQPPSKTILILYIFTLSIANMSNYLWNNNNVRKRRPMWVRDLNW